MSNPVTIIISQYFQKKTIWNRNKNPSIEIDLTKGYLASVEILALE